MSEEHEVILIVAVITVIDEDNATTTNLRQISDHMLRPIRVDALEPSMRDKRQFVSRRAAFVTQFVIKREFYFDRAFEDWKNDVLLVSAAHPQR